LKVILLDNKDSFTYNIVNILRCYDIELDVADSTLFSPEKLKEYDKIILSPGPGLSDDFPILKKAIRYSEESMKPLLGICLGHQAIGEYFGGQLIRMNHPVHGQRISCHVDNSNPLFKEIPKEIEVGMYHSWTIRSTPNKLKLIALSPDNVVLSFCHKTHPIYGVQFHPESFMSKQGKKILENFLSL